VKSEGSNLRQKGTPAHMGLIVVLFGFFSLSWVTQANLIPDASFETGTATWTLGGSASSIVSAPTRTGSKALRLINDHDGSQAPAHKAEQNGVSGAVAGLEYVYTVWVKGNDVGGIGPGSRPLQALSWRNAANQRLHKELVNWAPAGTYDWRQMKIRLQAPQNAIKFDVSFRSWWECTDGETYWDDASLAPRDFGNRGSLLADYQAESADIRSGGSVKTIEPDYTGSGYFDVTSDGAILQWNDVAGGGDRVVAARYSWEGNVRNLELFVNGVSKGKKKPTVTGRRGSWASELWNVNLPTGGNTVKLEIGFASGELSQPMIDRLEVYSISGSEPVPNAPSDLVTAPLSASSIGVTWHDNSSNESGFKIDRRQSGVTGPDAWVRIATPGTEASAHSDTGLPAATKFYYKVKAYNESGNSAYSNVGAATTLSNAAPQIAASPTNIAVSCVAGTDADAETFQVWNSGSGSLLYKVTETSSRLAVAPSTDSSTGTSDKKTHTVTFTTATLGVGTHNRTITIEDNGSGAPNGPIAIGVQITVTAAAPAPPSGLAATAISSSQINLSWTDNSANETGFKIDRRQSGVATWTVDHANIGAGLENHSDTGLPAETKFYYRVRAYNAAGESANTAVAYDTTSMAAVETVAKDALWRYRKGTAEASTPAAAWRERVFDDSGWSSGAAPLGYASGGWPTGTELADMRYSCTSVFLRRTFTVDNPELVEQVGLDIDFDDGFIAWVNGEEVARVHMAGVPGSFVACTANADTYVGGGSNSWATTLTGSDMPVLASSNVLAIQVFNIGDVSSDLMLNASLSVTLAELPGTEDADGDVLPDAWETEKLGTTNQPGSADTDNDGVSNVGEYIAGTDPGNSNAFFAVSVRHAYGEAIVSFPSTVAAGTGYAGRTRYYALQRKQLDGLGGWGTVPGYERVPAGGLIAFTNSSAQNPVLFRGRTWLE